MMFALIPNTAKRLILLSMIVLVAHTALRSQETVSTPSQFWLDINIINKFSDNLSFKGQTGIKTISPNNWTKYFVSGEVSWWIPKFMVKKLKYNERIYAGLDIYYLDSKNTQDAIEIAPYQGYTLTWPNRKRIDIKHNLEFSERIQWGVKNHSRSFGLRMSYEASLVFKLQGDLLKQGKGFYLSASAKFWWNLIETKVFNDVMRITPGIGYKINSKWKSAFYVGYNYTRDLSISEFDINSLIYRLRVYYTIN